MQKRCYSSANALELRLFCIKPSVWLCSGEQWEILPCFCQINYMLLYPCKETRAGSRLVPSQWETSLRSNGVSHWLGANLESAVRDCGRVDRESGLLWSMGVVAGVQCVQQVCGCLGGSWGCIDLLQGPLLPPPLGTTPLTLTLAVYCWYVLHQNVFFSKKFSFLVAFNTLKPQQNGCNFSDIIFYQWNS